MERTRPAGGPRWAGVVLVALTCGLVAMPAAPAAASSRPRVASLKVKLPAPGDVTLARVLLRVKIAPGSKGHHKRVKFRLRNRGRLARSVIILVGGKRVTATTAGVARLVAQSSSSATFVAAVAIFNPRAGAGIPRAHQASAHAAQDTAASFEASTEEEDTVLVTAEFHEDILALTASGHLVHCPKGSRVALHFTRAELVEVAGPAGISAKAAEEILDQAVEVCAEEAMAADELLFRWLNPGVTPSPAAFSGAFGGTTDAEGDTSRISITGGFNRAISGIAIWAPQGTQFTNCDPTPTCQIGGYGGGTHNSAYFRVSLLANQPFPPGLNIELSHAGNYTDTYQGQATATDGSTSPVVPFHLSG
jgi:hypothetical protein